MTLELCVLFGLADEEPDGWIDTVDPGLPAVSETTPDESGGTTGAVDWDDVVACGPAVKNQFISIGIVLGIFEQKERVHKQQ